MKNATKKRCENLRDVREALVNIRELTDEIVKHEMAKRATERQIYEWTCAIELYAQEKEAKEQKEGQDGKQEE